MEIQAVSLQNYSSLNIGGNGNLISVTKTAELIEALMYARKEGKHVHILGVGTNTFFGDELDKFLFIKIELKGITLTEEENNEKSDFFLKAYAGETWDDVVKFAVDKKLWGIENLSYIPGTAGAAPVQNIGAYGSELKDTLVSVEAIDLETLDQVEIVKDACKFGYRDSLFKQQKGKYVILSITLRLTSFRAPVLTYKPLDTLTEENVTLQEIRDLVVETRRGKLPDWKLHPNAGSFFKNPIVSVAQAEGLRITYPDMPLHELGDGYKIPAAWLIEHIANMKGVQEENVGTWPKQPLVIVNYTNANATELMAFSQKIIDTIYDKTGITLEREVQFVM